MWETLFKRKPSILWTPSPFKTPRKYGTPGLNLRRKNTPKKGGFEKGPPQRSPNMPKVKLILPK